tara:strand:- start:603 stop:1862 length:1260 start_codon:yes stop_codon:yes gene_type:complete
MVKKNLTLSFFSALAKIIGGIGLISILARAFSLADFGNFTYALTLGTVFGLIVDYGFNIKIIKDVSSNEVNVNKVVSKTIGSKFLLLLLSIILFITTTVLLKNTNELSLSGLFLFLSLVVFSFTNTFLSVFKGRKEYIKDLKVVIVDNLVTVIIVSIIAFITNDILYTSISFFFSKLIALVYSFCIYKRENEFVFPKYYDIIQDLKQALPYGVHYWVGSLYLNIDTIIMKPLVSEEDLGIYQSGIRIIIGLGILLTIINSVYLPLLNEYLNKNRNLFLKNILKLNTNVFRLSILSIVGMITFSKLIIIVLFGSKFLELQEIFWIIALIVGIRIIGSSYGILLTISDKQRLRAIAGALSIFIIIISDIILIPKYGYIAAAYVLLFAHVFITTFYVFSVYKEYKSLFIPSLKDFFNFKKSI